VPVLVFYLPDQDEWTTSCEQMLAVGFRNVSSYNPYWDIRGRTFEDLGGKPFPAYAQTTCESRSPAGNSVVSASPAAPAPPRTEHRTPPRYPPPRRRRSEPADQHLVLYQFDPTTTPAPEYHDDVSQLVTRCRPSSVLMNTDPAPADPGGVAEPGPAPGGSLLPPSHSLAVGEKVAEPFDAGRYSPRLWRRYDAGHER